MISRPEYLAFLNQKQVPTGILIQVLLFLRFALLKAVRSSFDDLNYSLMNLSRLFTVQLSMFFVVFSNSDILSRSEVFVNNFFIFLFQLFRADVLSFLTALIFYQIVCRLSTTFSKKIRTTYIANKSGERGIWTLAPVTRPIPLAGAPLRPLEYFSKVHNCQYDVVRYVCDAFNILLNFYLFVNPYFLYFILPVTVASFQTGIDPAYIFVNITP